MYVCLCKGITDTQIKEALSEGRASCMRSLNQQLGVASECGKCGTFAKQVLQENQHLQVNFHKAS